MRRILVCLGITFVMATAAPAWSDAAVDASFVNVSDGQVVAESVSLQAKGSSPAGVAKVVMTIDGVTVASVAPSSKKTEVPISFGWNTRTAPSGGVSRNGRYTVVVQAVDKDGSSDSAKVGVVVDNTPVQPSGLQASISHDQIKVSWSRNPEPDITGYVLERDSGGGFAKLAETDGTSFVDWAEPGHHTYRVIALRSGASGNKASSPSAPVSITVDDEPAPSASPGGTGGYDRTPGTTPTGGTTGGFPKRSATTARGNSGSGNKLSVGVDGFAAAGLPSGVALPGTTGLPSLPSAPAADDALGWGTYEEELPYDLPRGGVPLSAQVQNVAARAPFRVIPPDGMRWLAAGMWLLVAAALSAFAASRMEPEAPESSRGPTKDETNRGTRARLA